MPQRNDCSAQLILAGKQWWTACVESHCTQGGPLPAQIMTTGKLIRCSQQQAFTDYLTWARWCKMSIRLDCAWSAVMTIGLQTWRESASTAQSVTTTSSGQHKLALVRTASVYEHCNETWQCEQELLNVVTLPLGGCVLALTLWFEHLGQSRMSTMLRRWGTFEIPRRVYWPKIYWDSLHCRAREPYFMSKTASFNHCIKSIIERLKTFSTMLHHTWT